MILRVCLLIAVLLLAAARTALAADDDVAVGGPTPVAAQNGYLVYSVRQDDGRYVLTVQRPDGTPQTIPGGPRTTPFDADVGTDTRDAPELVYSRDGELFTFSLTRDDGERPVRNANDPRHDDVAPTLWRGRIAWTRIYAGGPVVY